MTNANLLKTNLISQVIIFLVILFAPINESLAKSGCCSHHGGVASCDVLTGHSKCNDGTNSPSCGCDGKTADKVKTKKTTSVTTTAVPAITAPVSTRGCCAHHGGVSNCNKKTGYSMCKDGTQSSGCKC